MSIRAQVLDEFKRVAEQQQRNLPPMEDNLMLVDSGLDSLCIAVIVARLEDTLGLDPFSIDQDSPYPITVGEFVQFYERNATRLRLPAMHRSVA